MTQTKLEQVVRRITAPLVDEPGALLPVLHALQDHFGHIPTAAVATVAQLLSLSRAEVHGVISFYDWFQSEPGGDTTVYICRAEACRAMGGAAVETAAKQHLGIDFHQCSRDGRISLQPIYCLGNCACSPSVMVDEQLFSRVTSDKIIEILDAIAGGNS